MTKTEQKDKNNSYESYALTQDSELEPIKAIKKVLSTKKILDLTHLKTYTIDDKDSYEIDDAISLEERGLTKLIWIHISDPTSVIPKDSVVDLKARSKALTIYLANKVIYMLPKDIINLMSLKQGKSSLTLSVGVNIDLEGNILNYIVSRALIKPNYNLTYEEADELIDYSPEEERDLLALSKTMELRRKIRGNNGAIQLEQPEGRFKIQDDIRVLNIIEPTESRKLVSECMILLGHVIASYAESNRIPVLYRSQGITTKTANQPIENANIPAVNNSVIKQRLTRAITSTQSNQHYSLGLNIYVQATSPLRRYSDMLVHRQILAYLDDNPMYSRDELNRLLYDLEPCQRQAIDIMKEDKSINQFKWFTSNSRRIWATYFLRYLSKKKNTVLLYFEELEMEISCTIMNIDSWDIGKRLLVKFVNTNEITKQLEFLITG